MPVDRLEPLGTLQKIPWNIIINERHVLQPHTWYTCPAGKKALVQATATCTSVGASAEAYIEINAVRMRKWGGVATAGYAGTDGIQATLAQQGLMPPNVLSVMQFSLNAGETIITTQDGGFTNAEFNILLEIQESDI